MGKETTTNQRNKIMVAIATPKFELGQVVQTAGAMQAAQNTGELFGQYLRRHIMGDWGECCADDVKENEWSLENGERLMSVYLMSDKTKIWVITERDRSVTTILLPSEY
jgi:hypothetical protein